MDTAYLTALGLGVVVLGLQILLTLFGAVTDVPDIDVDADLDVSAGPPGHALGAGEAATGASGAAESLNLLSTRALAGGVALLGAVGIALDGVGVPWPLSLPAAVGVGFLGTYGTAHLSRALLRLESDGTLRLADAVGQPAKVYLTVTPGEVSGRVLLALQGRTVELRAVTPAARPLPAGTDVVVVGLQDGDTVEVVPLTAVEEIL